MPSDTTMRQMNILLGLIKQDGAPLPHVSEDDLGGIGMAWDKGLFVYLSKDGLFTILGPSGKIILKSPSVELIRDKLRTFKSLM